MTTIRHICDGHEYRYDTLTGDVRNNYGSLVSALRICRLSGYVLLYRVTPHWPVIYAGKDLPIASCRAPDGSLPGSIPSDAALAQWAIGQTALHIPEAR